MSKILFLFLAFTLAGCGAKVNYSFTVPLAVTHAEEKTVLQSYPVESIEMEKLNANN